MPVAPDLLPIESVPSPSRPLAQMRVVNAYAEKQQIGARTTWARFGSPGIVTGATCGSGPIRGLHVMGGTLYAVSGNSLYSIASNYTATQVGAGIVGTDNVSMADNGVEIAIVGGGSGLYGWTYSTAAGLNQITSTYFYGPKTVTFFDSYFVFDRNGTSQIYHSELNDGQSYVFTNRASAEAESDYVVAVMALGALLYVFGTNTIELWYDAGAADFPFRRYDGGTIMRGCAAPKTVCLEDNTLFFLGEDYIAYRLLGTRIMPISNEALSAEWQSYGRVDDAFAFAWTWRGRKFVAFSFPSANKTWVCDIAYSKWHERETLDVEQRANLWRGSCSAVAYNKTWIGDRNSNRVGYLDGNTYTEFGDSFTTKFVLPILAGHGKRLFMPSFELDAEAGTGLATGQGSDPTWMLRISDNGRSWSPYVWARSSGQIGDYIHRMRWSRMGSFFNRVMELSISDPVKRVAYEARAPGLYMGD